jgi:3-oxoacyl-[acyl-carrier protein] reductase
MKLHGKVALVTGAGTGIGRAIVLAFAREGAAVAVNYSKSEAPARETAGEVEKAGARAMLVKADVSRDPEARRMVDEVARELGGLDILVNNAGWTQRVQPHRDLERLTDDIWDRVMAVNVKGAFYCARAAVPHMDRRGGGAIVNITSVAAMTGLGSSMAYAASKAALATLTLSLARALAPARIRVNAVAPGLIATGFGGWTSEAVDATAAVTAIGRAATVEETADAVLFMVANGAMTGYATVVDGGLVPLGPIEQPLHPR